MGQSFRACTKCPRCGEWRPNDAIAGLCPPCRSGGRFLLLMEFVEGVNLRQLMRVKKLTPKEALSIVPPVCEALQCAYDHGIVNIRLFAQQLHLT